ncbi:MBL fold metallo-hydrolase [Micromonospora sp. NBC_01699]|uniref:MBL fold metallo-hydrolase n=1 Tax=Micromonospora sp. NBC_01699 TaxID=2975984 RepID=UPI002E2D985D|nr:MBL fold metallo-hydrolase [Micromonospora sp. NBC_01699]
MRLTKKGHACVRLEQDGTTLVFDPGAYSDPDALAGADAVLITHEHQDHFVEDRIRAAVESQPRLRVFANRAVAAKLDGLGERLRIVGEGDTFSVNGIDIAVYGELHAVIHPDIPRITNVGYLVNGELFHPGDALTVPDRPIATLLLPAHAPWSKTAELIEYVREVSPQQAIPVHDAGLSDTGRSTVQMLMGGGGPTTGVTYRPVADGETAEV